MTKLKLEPLPKPFETNLAKAFNKKESDFYIELYQSKDTIHSIQIGKIFINPERAKIT